MIPHGVCCWMIQEFTSMAPMVTSLTLIPGRGVFNLNGFGGFFGRYDLGNGNLRYVKNVGNQLIYSMTRFANRLYIVW